jgi:hypothetical protein
MSNNNIKFAALDVHASSTTFVVLDDQGKVILTGVIETGGESLLSLVQGISGRVHLTFEEGTHARWLYELLKPHVEKLVVCNPRKNRRQSESKNDRIDAEQLARWLRSGDLTPVYHDNNRLTVLSDLVRGYEHITDDNTRAKNRLKAIYRSRGIQVRGCSVYNPDKREDWLGQLDLRGLRTRAEWLFWEIDFVSALAKDAGAAVEREARKHQACRLLKTTPGIGWLRSATIVSHVVSPFRFRTKRQFWSYCGFGVVTWSSADWEKDGSGFVMKRTPPSTRGLNRKHNRHLKGAIKGAASTAIRGGGVFAPHFEVLVASGMRESMARLTVARKIAATVITIWKKGEKFNLSKAVIRTE